MAPLGTAPSQSSENGLVAGWNLSIVHCLVQYTWGWIAEYIFFLHLLREQRQYKDGNLIFPTLIYFSTALQVCFFKSS